MNTHAEKTKENHSQSIANAVSQKQRGPEAAPQLENKDTLQAKSQDLANTSAQIQELSTFQQMADNSHEVKKVAQMQSATDQHHGHIQRKENNTGLPDSLKQGIETLSNYSMDDVKVHYNSDKPAQLQAHAYAQGADIYLGSGQEKHLPHEAWHVVQQKQGRVKPTVQMKDKVNINDDANLEKEADVMGAKAMQLKADKTSSNPKTKSFSGNEPVQRVLLVNGNNVSRELIAGRQEDFKYWCAAPMAEAGYVDISPEQWIRIFSGMDAVAADPRVFNFARTSHLMRRILAGDNIEAIAAQHAQQANEQDASSSSDIGAVLSSEPKPKAKKTDKSESAVQEDSAPPKEDGVRKMELSEGVFSGTYECSPDRNWADLHVVGATGGKADPSALFRYFNTVYQLMLGHFKFTGVPGVLEWHPTGAVVTKQIVELLGESLGSWKQWVAAKYEQKKRKSADKKSDRTRNKLAGKINPEIVPEHMHFLKSLKGAEGLSIGAVGLPVPPEVMELLRSEKGQQMKAEEVEALMRPDMTSDSPAGNAALESYEQALKDPEQQDGPSLIIKLDFRQLPKLMAKLK